MIIIVEGIDRVGKTTLCNKLHEEFNIPIYKHNGIIPYNKMDNFEETDKMIYVKEFIELTNISLIFDRFHLTDFVYGELERNYDIINAKNNFKIIDDAISELDDVFLIYILPTDIQKSSKEHGKDLRTHDSKFYYLFKKSKIKNKWRCTYNTLDEAILFIKSILEKEKIK